MDVWEWSGATFLRIGLFCHFSAFNEVEVSFSSFSKHFNTSETKNKSVSKTKKDPEDRKAGRIVLVPHTWCSCQSANS
jgi:hypothetical protein